VAEENARITISEERLKLALAEMELRLRVYFDEQLKHKADQGDFVQISLAVNNIVRGDFSPSHRRGLVSVVEDVIESRSSQGWTRRERLFAYVAVVVTILTFGMGLYVTASNASASSGPPPTTLEER
jgi:hypothetical protein